MRNGLFVDWGGGLLVKGGGTGEPRNKISTELYQLLYVPLRNLWRNIKEGNLKGFFTKVFPPNNSIHNVCLVSSFFIFFKVSLLGT